MGQNSRIQPTRHAGQTVPRAIRQRRGAFVFQSICGEAEAASLGSPSSDAAAQPIHWHAYSKERPLHAYGPADADKALAWLVDFADGL